MVQSVKTALSTRLIFTDQPALWRSVLPASRSVFGSVEFCSIVQDLQGQQACLFVLAEDHGQIAYPFFLRGTNVLPYNQRQTPGWDTRTPEYTGPVLLEPISPRVAASFRQSFVQLSAEIGIVAEFAHLHPWEANHDLLNQAGLQHDRQIVYVDLTQSSEQLWQESFNHACRKNIRRAQHENVRVFRAQTAADVQEFHRIYIGTMDRNQAAGHYYFPLSYFTGLLEARPDNTLMLLAEYQGRVVAGTLYMVDGDNLYSYLGGANQEYQQVRPTNAVVYAAIEWGQAHGQQRLILGGGYQPDDGIFRFKSSFSPLRADFYTYRWVHLPDEYQRLCQAWSTYYAAPLAEGHFFPLYRSAPPSRPANSSVGGDPSPLRYEG